MNHFIDSAVDKAANVAKVKVKSMLGGGGGAAGDSKKQGKSGGGLGGLGGIGGLFPSASDGGKKETSKGGGLFDGLKTSPSEEPRYEPSGGASGGAENSDFSSAVDELAGL
ncbi:uncharacterized protein zgc:193505 [Astyanax mexicanus]|uniref:Glycine-rich protein 5-like n=1 Tax=Astyanax mexicanus TaxID=7994 RepID=A0A8T2LVV3_ASTMX|nr:uncharacterized protein zgc:193505 [Astyanax mexicanus]KAG9275550.1 glycine-rich protein 5-like [Astyanax mexicanus]